MGAWSIGFRTSVTAAERFGDVEILRRVVVHGLWERCDSLRNWRRQGDAARDIREAIFSSYGASQNRESKDSRVNAVHTWNCLPGSVARSKIPQALTVAICQLRKSFDPCLARAPDQPTADPRHCKVTGANAVLMQARLITRDLTAYLTAWSLVSVVRASIAFGFCIQFSAAHQPQRLCAHLYQP